MKFRLFWLGVILCFGQLAYGAQFLSIADIHFDPFTTCQESTPCPLIDKLQQAPVNEWKQIISDTDNSEPLYKKDSNFKLLETSLAAASYQAKEQGAKFVVILGDFLAHAYRVKYFHYATSPTQASYEIFVNKTFQFLVSEFKTSFPDLNIYATLGNNDSYNDDYSVGAANFYQDLAPLFASLIKDDKSLEIIQNQFSQNGYYALDIPNQKHLRLIVLNSVIFANKAQGDGISLLATEELKWLNNELKNLRITHQKALIIMHIPDGIDVYATLKVNAKEPIPFFKPDYSRQYEFLLKTYSENIMGILVAHLHTDGFQLLPYSKPIVVSFTPSISPNIQTNPAFKIYQFSSHSLELKDFKTYSYSLGSLKEWQEEYDFNDVYQPGCTHCRLANGMIAPPEFLSENYINYFDVGTYSQPIKDKWNPYYKCALHNSSIGDYGRCVEHTVIPAALRTE